MKRICRHSFTLIEVIVSMAVFALLMLGLMQFFTSAQNLWTATSNKTQTFDEARAAMNMIAADLMCAYYEEGTNTTTDHRYFFIVQDPATGAAVPQLSGTDRFKGLAFATIRPAKTNKDAASRLTEVFYRKSGNILETKTIADNENGSLPWVTTQRLTHFTSFAMTPFADLEDANYSSNTDAAKQHPYFATDGWDLIASNIVRFYVKIIAPHGNSRLNFSSIYNTAGTSVTKFPGLVSMTLITIDEQTAKKIKLMTGNNDLVFETLLNNNNDEVTDDTTPQGALLKEKMQTFVRTVYIDRGLE